MNEMNAYLADRLMELAKLLAATAPKWFEGFSQTYVQLKSCQTEVVDELRHRARNERPV